jgi:type IV pilus assembly protein PilA
VNWQSRVEPKRKNPLGISAVEIAVGVAILLVIAAIAIPNLLHSNLSSNESSAAGSLRTLNSACASYAMLYGGYPRSLANLGPGNPTHSGAADLIDSVLVSGRKDGYVFTYTPGATGVSGNVLSYSITASPVTPGTTGRRSFFTDQSGVIRANISGVADETSTPVG